MVISLAGEAQGSRLWRGTPHDLESQSVRQVCHRDLADRQIFPLRRVELLVRQRQGRPVDCAIVDHRLREGRNAIPIFYSYLTIFPKSVEKAQ